MPFGSGSALIGLVTLTYPYHYVCCLAPAAAQKTHLDEVEVVGGDVIVVVLDLGKRRLVLLHQLVDVRVLALLDLRASFARFEAAWGNSLGAATEHQHAQHPAGQLTQSPVS